MYQALTAEIVSHILGNLGLIPNAVGQKGLTEKPFAQKPLILTEETDGQEVKKTFPTWAAQLKLDDGSSAQPLMVELANLSDENQFEFLGVIQLGESPIHALKFLSNLDCSERIGYYYLKSKEQWIQAAILYQAQALAGMENITSNGLIWEPTTSNLRFALEGLAIL